MSARLDFENVYAACEPAVRAFVLRRIGPDGVDDVVSEVFLAAWRRHGDIPDDALPWLLNISRGVVANRRRSHGRGAALLERLTREEVVSVAARSAEVDLGVADALAQMSAGDQELLLLVAWEGRFPAAASHTDHGGHAGVGGNQWSRPRQRGARHPPASIPEAVGTCR